MCYSEMLILNELSGTISMLPNGQCVIIQPQMTPTKLETTNVRQTQQQQKQPQHKQQQYQQQPQQQHRQQNQQTQHFTAVKNTASSSAEGSKNEKVIKVGWYKHTFL